MQESEFREAVQSGLGRAIIYARENDVRAFRDVILDACLHCYSADAQSEGTRAPYMLELVNLTPDRGFYCSEVLKALPGCGDDWDTVQRFRFASYLAADGDDRAKQAMYENFDPGPKRAEDMCVDFVRMDGLDGFLFAAEKMGALLIAKPSEVDEGYLLWHAIETFGEGETFDALRKAGEVSERAEAYRLTAQASWADRDNRRCKWEETNTLQYEELKPRLSGLSACWLGRWGEQANPDNLEHAARDLTKAQTPEEQLPYLRIFRSRAFPLDHALLLRLAASDDERVALASAIALAKVTHPSVRELAFQLVESRAAGRHEAISMLAQNWESGDHEIALGWFEHEEDRHARHCLGIDLRRFWKRHPEPASEVRMLLRLYERGPCSSCREFLLRRLIELDGITVSMRAECAYDANNHVRQLFTSE